MRYVIEHETRLEFSHPVREHQCELRLAPPDTASQRAHGLRIEIEPPAELYTYVDGFGNRVHHFGVTAPHQRLTTRVRAEVETLLANPFDYAPVPVREEREWIVAALRSEPRLWDYLLHRSVATPDLASIRHDLALPAWDPDRSVLDAVKAAMECIGAALVYRAGVTQVHSPLEHALAARAGVCQDFAHLLIALVRSWRLLARYAMGYLDPGYAEGDALPAQTPHAWAEVLIPGAGWRGFDPVHRLVANDTFVTVAVGRDSRDAAPQRGSFKGDTEGEVPQVTLSVTRQQ